MSEYDTDGDSSGVECPRVGCGFTSGTMAGVKRHHALAHGESIAGEVVECSWCGETKTVPPAIKQRSEHHFCDAECYGEWQSENCQDEASRRWEGGKVAIQCDQCGEEALMWKHRVGKNDRQFCDDDCYKEWLSEHRVGEDHPSWRGGEYPRDRGTNWPALREKTLEEYAYECQGCGRHDDGHRAEHGVGLHVHHIQPVRQFDEPSDADTVDNLIPLCRDCHPEWEKIAPLRPQTSDPG